MIQDKKIGLTGASGLIGKALRKKLSGPVVLLVRTLPESINANEELVIGNFSDLEVAETFTSKIHILIHAAASVGPRSIYEDHYIKDDLIGTIDLAKRFFKNNPQGHFIYLSTAGGLYDLENYDVKTEETEVEPRSLYGAIKLIIETSLENIKGKSGKVTILRPSAVYGEAFRKNQSVGLIDKLLRTTIDTGASAVPIFDKMDSARDYIHIEDLSDAIESVISRMGLNYEIFNVGTGVEHSIEEVIGLINKVKAGSAKTEIIEVDSKRTSLIVNSNKLGRSTGWLPKITLEAGIKKMYEELNQKGNV